MKTRFENAVNKLYKAFNEGTLNSFDCKHCAVGNLCDNNKDWAEARPSLYSDWDFDKQVSKKSAEKSGYSLRELAKIEKIFTTLVPYELSKEKEPQFKGLIAVINYLAELDGIESIDEQFNKFKAVLDRETQVDYAK